MRAFKAVLFCLAVLTMSQSARAAIVLDQSNTVMYSTMVGTNHYQQGVTDGVTGVLSFVDLYTGAGNINFRIAKGSPVQTGNWLFNQTLAVTAGWNHIDVSAANISLTAGDHFLLDWNGNTNSPLIGVSTGSGYTGGDLWKVTGSNGTTSIYGGTWDMLFRTYVNDPPAVATPEPASMAILGCGLAGMAALRRRRRRDAGVQA